MLARSPAGIAIVLAALPEELAASLDSRDPASASAWSMNSADGSAVTIRPCGDCRAEAAADRRHRQAHVAAVARAYLGSLDQSAAPTGPGARSAAKDETTAGTAAEVNPDLVRSWQARTARLLADAGETAQSIPDPAAKDETTRHGGWESLGPWPKRPSPRGPSSSPRPNASPSRSPTRAKAWALSEVAEAVAATDPDRAARSSPMLNASPSRSPTRAEGMGAGAASRRRWLPPTRTAPSGSSPMPRRIAQSITDENTKSVVLRGVVEAMAATDPDRAERIAQSVTDPTPRQGRCERVAEGVAATDPDRAERIAKSITDKYKKASALQGVAAAVAATDPDHAGRIAKSITDDSYKVWRWETSSGQWLPLTRTVPPDSSPTPNASPSRSLASPRRRRH